MDRLEPAEIPEEYRTDAKNPTTGAALPSRYIGGMKFSVPATGDKREEVWIILKRTTLGPIAEVRGPIEGDPAKAPHAYFFLSELRKYLSQTPTSKESIYSIAGQCSMNGTDLARLIRMVANQHGLITDF